MPAHPRASRPAYRAAVHLGKIDEGTAPDWSSIPAPVDDGRTGHLVGAHVASVHLPATNSGTVDLSAFRGRTLYADPRTVGPAFTLVIDGSMATVLWLVISAFK